MCVCVYVYTQVTMVIAKKSEGCSNFFQNEESPLRDSKVVPKTAGHAVGNVFLGPGKMDKIEGTTRST